jgi:hypothetical protein
VAAHQDLKEKLMNDMALPIQLAGIAMVLSAISMVLW